MILQREWKKKKKAKAEVLFQSHIRAGKYLSDLQEKKGEHDFQKAQSQSDSAVSAGHPLHQALGTRLTSAKCQSPVKAVLS